MRTCDNRAKKLSKWSMRNWKRGLWMTVRIVITATEGKWADKVTGGPYKHYIAKLSKFSKVR